MAVPGHDARDHAFAQKFALPIVEVVAGGDVQKEAFESKEGTLVNSPLIDGLNVEEGKKKMLDILEAEGLGEREVQYKLRDAAFGRQRYWGEPIPIYYEQGIPKKVRDEHLLLELPEVSSFLPTEDGDPPLGNAQHWSYLPEKGVVPNGEGHPIECTTMPGWAGSSWYWLRYMSPNAQNGFTEPQAENYWRSVDLYFGGAEHATGHLLYSRFWQKVPERPRMGRLGRTFRTPDQPGHDLGHQCTGPPDRRRRPIGVGRTERFLYDHAPARGCFPGREWPAGY